MDRSQRGDDGLGEVRAVLLRLKRFSAQPDNAEFQGATKDAPVRSRRIAVAAVSAAASIVLIVAGAFALLGSRRSADTAMVWSAPELAAQDTGRADAPQLAVQDRARAERFLVRGDEYLANGNVIGARDFFGRAADAGLAAGALRLAATYDPGELQRLQALGVVPDPALARTWYERARQLGAPEAAERLARLTGN